MRLPPGYYDRIIATHDEAYRPAQHRQPVRLFARRQAGASDFGMSGTSRARRSSSGPSCRC
jgi:hypothetical protein